MSKRECNCIHLKFIELLEKRQLQPKPNGYIIGAILKILDKTKQCDKISPQFMYIRRKIVNTIDVDRYNRILEYKEDEQDLVVAGQVLDRYTIVAKQTSYDALSFWAKLYYMTMFKYKG